MNLIKNIVIGAVVFSILSMSALVNWPFQFAVGCFSLQICDVLLRIFKARGKIILLALPFHIVYVGFNIYDLFFQNDLLNYYVLPLPVSLLISFLIFKKHKLGLNFKSMIFSSFILAVAYTLYASFIISVDIKINTNRTKKIYIAKKVEYYWSTSCAACIKSMPELKPLVDQQMVTPFCVYFDKKDSLHALNIMLRRSFKSQLIRFGKDANYMLFPTWEICKGNNKYTGSIPYYWPMGIRFSLGLWDVFY